MKTKIYFLFPFLLLAFLLPSTSGMAIAPIFMPTVIADSSMVNGHWQASSYMTLTYDTKGNMLQRVVNTFDSTGVKSDAAQLDYTYDSQGRLINYNYKINMGGSLINFQMGSFTYDNKNRRILSQTFSWNFVSNSWDSSRIQITSYSYNNSDSLTYSVNYYTYPGTTKANDSLSAYFYTYDNSGRMTSEIYKTYTDSAWMTSSEIYNNYNSQGQLITIIENTYLAGTLSFTDRSTLTYNSSGNLTTELQETSNDSGNTWENTYYYTYEYDANQHLIKETEQDWTAGQWVNSTLYNYTYDSNGNLIEELTSDWNGSAWEPSHKTDYIYKDVSVSAVTDNSDYSGILVTAYPNPANELITFDYSLAIPGNVMLTLYDYSGKYTYDLVSQQQEAGNYNYKFDARQLPDGVYIYELKVNDVKISRKVIINK